MPSRKLALVVAALIAGTSLPALAQGGGGGGAGGGGAGAGGAASSGSSANGYGHRRYISHWRRGRGNI